MTGGTPAQDREVEIQREIFDELGSSSFSAILVAKVAARREAAKDADIDLLRWLLAEAQWHREWTLKAAENELKSHDRAEERLRTELAKAKAHIRHLTNAYLKADEREAALRERAIILPEDWRKQAHVVDNGAVDVEQVKRTIAWIESWSAPTDTEGPKPGERARGQLPGRSAWVEGTYLGTANGWGILEIAGDDCRAVHADTLHPAADTPCGNQVIGLLDRTLTCTKPAGHAGSHADGTGTTWTHRAQ